jgi:RHS repeat-associated protein
VPGSESVYDVLGRVKWTRTWEDVAVPLADLLDDSNNVIGKTNTFTEANEPNWSHGKLLSVSKTHYDTAGRVRRTETQDENGDYQPTRYEYDGAGRQLAVIDALDNRSEYEYLGNRRVLTRDARGHVTRFVHDDIGRVAKTVFDDGTFTYSDYDELGRRTNQIDQAGRLRRFEYDKGGRLTAVTLPDVNDPENSDTPTHPRYEYEYDDYSNLTLIRDKVKLDRDTGQIDANSARETKFTYNEFNLQASRTLPNGKTEYKYYNQKAQLIKAVDFKGQVTAYTYGHPNVPGAVHYQRFYRDESYYQSSPNDPNLSFEFTYDKLGRKTAVEVNDEGQTCVYSYDYDSHGRVEYIFTPDGNIRYDYSDITGRVKSVYTPAGTADTEVDYYYDELGRLAEVEAVQLNDQDANDITAYTYNAVGSLATVTYANGNLAQYTYNTLNRLTNLTNWQTPAKATALSSYQYTLSPDGQRKAVTEVTSEGTTNINWSYDKLNRLTVEDYNAPGDANDFDHEYVYDLVGNRTKKIVDVNLVTTYSYNTTDQLEYETTDSNSIVYSYDDNGALVFKDSDTDANVTYAYNLRRRLSKVEIENAEIVEYLYNPDGIRVHTDVNDSGSLTTTKHIIDTQNHTGYAQVLKEVGDSNTVYVTGLDVVAQATGASNPQYFLYDGHGSVRALANNAGSVLEHYNYQAYGTLHNFAGTPTTNMLYAGEMHDPYTTQYYLRARWYTPGVGRFGTMDPYRGKYLDPQTLHKYSYVHNNPVNGVDPTGRLFSNPALGKQVHDEIGARFVASGVGRHYNRSIGRLLGVPLPMFGRFRPDLVDTLTGEVYEIKPLGAGLAGHAQLSFYLLLLNSLDPDAREWRRGKSLAPPPVIPLGKDSYAFVGPPVKGLISYEVIDFRLLVMFISGMAIARLMVEVSIRIQLKLLTPGLAYI